MSTKNPTGYCPRCQQQVLLTRKDFDTCLAIVLLLFTGIGFIIYLVYYYGKKEDRCVHCGTQITFSQTQAPTAFQTQPQIQQSSPSIASSESEALTGKTPIYCTYCGEKLDAVTIKFCPNCGSKVGNP